MKSYALTLKWNSNPNPTRLEYMECVSALINQFKRIMVYNWAYEADSKNKLHIHLHIKCKYIRWKEWVHSMTSKGFHVHNQELKSEEDCQRWDNYLTKQRLTAMECEQINVINEIYAQNYPFIEQEVVKTLINDEIKSDGSLGHTETFSVSDESKVSAFSISFD